MNLNVRTGDNVKVLTGKDKGKTGKVLAVDPKTNKVLVEDVNIATHHIKARSANQPSGIKKVAAPLDASNVQVICPSCGKSVRLRHQEIDGKNVRICAKCGASVDTSVKAEKTKKKAEKAEKKSAKKKADKAEVADTAAETAAEEKPAKKAAPKKTAKKPAGDKE